MARCRCDDGELTLCTRRCGHCSGCLACSINRAGGRCYCIRLKPDCKHRAFNPSFPGCRCDDGETTLCTGCCGHCGGCLSCYINRETGKCNCVSLKSDCNHAAFNPSFPDCRCDDGETTACTGCCGHCGGCLSCYINRETGKCNCVNLKSDCNHAAFNPSFPGCRCDDGETTACTRCCGHCGGCLSCYINRETGKCNCVSLKSDCNHAAFNPSFPDCRCDDGETTVCTRRCGYCGGCLECNVNQTTGKCDCIDLKPGCEHTSESSLPSHDDLIVLRELDSQTHRSRSPVPLRGKTRRTHHRHSQSSSSGNSESDVAEDDDGTTESTSERGRGGEFH